MLVCLKRSFNMCVLLFIFCLCKLVLSFTLINDDFFQISITEHNVLQSSDDNYFGYSLLLQQGTPNQLVIGSPKRKSPDKKHSYISICDVKMTNCTKYHVYSFSSTEKDFDFLGIVLDGGEKTGDKIITCAPRSSTFANTYYLNGRCMDIDTQTTSLHNITLPVNGRFNQVKSFGSAKFYEYAFAEAGMSLKYIKESNEVLIGAPGLTGWNGAVISKLLDFDEYEILPHRQNPEAEFINAYFGYSVDAGKFLRNSRKIYYLAGVPRGNKLKGEVLLFEKSNADNGKLVIHKRFLGDELGSYFGAAILAMDLTGDGLDDVIVGAPTCAGETWDEGCIYLYENLGNKVFEPRGKLYGSQKSGSRFGTVISYLGDVELSGFNCFAVAAPYEDDGTGAVYVYQNHASTISKIYVQRITPADFPKYGNLIKGFGQGISKGLDVNGDLHKDVAIGAYKSKDIFVLHSYKVAKFMVNISADMTVLYPDTPELNIRYCFQYKQNNNMEPTQGNIVYTLLLDYRSSNVSTKRVIPSSSNITCKNEIIYLKDPVRDFSPFSVSIKTELENVDGEAKLNIPYSYGCGDDDICESRIQVTAKIIDRAVLILGQDKELKIDVDIVNKGETALQTSLVISVPGETSIINVRNCDIKNMSYVCPMANRFTFSSRYHKTIHLDTSKLTTSTKQLIVKLKVMTLGTDIGNGTKIQLNIPVILENKPYIAGSAEPDDLVYATKEKFNDNTSVTHHYIVGNSGPSPYLLNISIFVPTIIFKSQEVIHFQGVKAITDNEEETLSCFQKQDNPHYSTNKTEQLVDVSKTNELSRSIPVDCHLELVNCLNLICNGTYLPSGGTAKLSIEIVISNLGLLATHLEKEFFGKDIVLLSSTAYIRKENVFLKKSVSTLIYLPVNHTLPLWIAVVTLATGFFILAIIVFALYKCHFFERTYRNKLQSMQSERHLLEDDQSKEETLSEFQNSDQSEIELRKQ